MNFANLSPSDLAGGIAGLLLTLMVFSYLLGDNFLFRLAIHIFIGVSAGYVAVMVVYNVLFPQLILPFLSGDRVRMLFVVLPLLLSGLLLTKSSTRLANWGSPAVAYLVGVGVAAVVGGAVLGTIFPQIGATVRLFDVPVSAVNTVSLGQQMIDSSFILVGTLTSLIYFHIGGKARLNQPAQRAPVIEVLAAVGGVFIAIALGVIFAGVYAASLTAMVTRLHAVIDFILALVVVK
jgi:hypothetical protein